MSTRLGWHWVGETLRDGRPVPPDGETLVHDGPLQMCVSGLHASRWILDALWYAPGSTVCRVRLGGDVIEEEDKMVARERTILWRVDAGDILREFARRCALDVVHLWDATEVVVRYLRTGDSTIREAAWLSAYRGLRGSNWHPARGAAMWASGASSPHVIAAQAAMRANGSDDRHATRERLNRRLIAMVSAHKPDHARSA